MKKMMLVLCLAFGVTQAQIAVNTNGAQITNNQLFTFNQTNISAELPFIVTNTSEDSPINVKIRVDQIQNSDGTNLQLCFGGLCFFSINQGTIYPTNFAVTLEPGQSTMAGDHFWNSNPGDGVNYPMTYKLTFVQVNDNGVYMNDLLSFTYQYNPNLAVSDFAGMASVGIAKINTLVTSEITLEASQSGTLEVFDMSGKVVARKVLSAGIGTLAFSDAAKGVYIARFTNGQNQSAQLKIVKN